MDNQDFNRHIFKYMADGVLFVDNQNKIRICNSRAAELRDVDSNELIGSDIFSCHSPKSKKPVSRVIASLSKKSGKVHIETIKKGRRSFEIKYSAIFDENNNNLGVLAVSRDITEKLALDKKLSKLSTTDDLTKLFNHRQFFEILPKEIARAQRLSRPLSLLLFDLDNFKSLNDSQGHYEGDRLLRKIGRLVKSNIRRNVDQAFRYGGDEFTIILPEADTNKAIKAGNRLCSSVARADYNGITLSIGAVGFDHQKPCDAATLLSRADRSMYHAKQSGGNQLCLFRKKNEGGFLLVGR